LRITRHLPFTDVVLLFTFVWTLLRLPIPVYVLDWLHRCWLSYLPFTVGCAFALYTHVYRRLRLIPTLRRCSVTRTFGCRLVWILVYVCRVGWRLLRLITFTLRLRFGRFALLPRCWAFGCCYVPYVVTRLPAVYVVTRCYVVRLRCCYVVAVGVGFDLPDLRCVPLLFPFTVVAICGYVTFPLRLRWVDICWLRLRDVVDCPGCVTLHCDVTLPRTLLFYVLR